jgi:hypothetical protein
MEINSLLHMYFHMVYCLYDDWYTNLNFTLNHNILICGMLYTEIFFTYFGLSETNNLSCSWSWISVNCEMLKCTTLQHAE